MSKLTAFDRGDLQGYAIALTIGALGGALFAWFRIPLAWMIGAMVANTIASMLGLKVRVPSQLRALMIVVIGVMLGASFTPELFSHVGEWAITLGGVMLYVAISTAIIYVYFRRLCGYDPATAYFSAAPGGFNEMVMVGGAMGGDDRGIALVHASRVLLVVLTIPFYFRLSGDYVPANSMLPAIGGGSVSLEDAAILTVCGIVGIVVGRIGRLPAYALLGPMIVSALVHMTSLSAAKPPALVVALAQLVIGSAVGCRFAGTPVRQVRDAIVMSTGATALLMALTLAFAWGVARLTDLSAVDVLLAYAPGGLAEMSLVALALHSDAAFVATHHVFRILVVIVAAPVTFRLLRRWTR